MVWKLPQVNAEDIDLFTEKYGTDPLTSSLLLARNIVDPGELKYFLDDDLRSLHNPFLFSQMDLAVSRIQAAVSEEERVLVFGDRDTDGITATAVLVSALRQEGLEVFWELPMGDDPYSLNSTVVDSYAEKDVTLIITVDCGVGNITEIAQARERGIDCIVVDHHNPGETLPDTTAIINPKCNFEHYPFEGLSAVGLVLKLLVALDIAKSDFYEQPFCFLNLRPGNESTIVEAVKILNLTEQSRISETIVPGAGEKQLTRIIDFIKDQPIFVYQRDLQVKFLNEIFGNSLEFVLNDISEEIWKEFPALRGKSLLTMLERSRLSKFSRKPMQEIDAAVQLLISYFHKKSPFIIENMKTHLDLVALGLIADMMPLRNENRTIIRHGLKILENTPRRGLRELMARLSLLGTEFNSNKVSWRLTPAINATGRMGQPDLAVRLLLEEGDVVELADTIFTLNKKRKQQGSNAWKFILPQAEKSLQDYGGVLICVCHDTIIRGITGILAGQLSRRFNVPAIVIAHLGDSYSGSVRSARGFHVTDFLAQFSDLFVSSGGHTAAGGFRLKKEHYKDFLAELKKKSAFIELTGEEKPQLNIDLPLEAADLTEDLETFQQALEPVGQDFHPVHYMLRNIQIDSSEAIGKDASHLKLLLSIMNRKWPAVYWSATDRFQNDFSEQSPVDCVFTLERNYFGNNSNLRLTILDMCPHEA